MAVGSTHPGNDLRPIVPGVIHHRGYLISVHALVRIRCEDPVREAASSIPESNQRLSFSRGRITGILLWMGLRKSLASVVMMVQDGTTFPWGSFHVSHSPAMAKGSPDFRIIL